jgi:hemolysin activation/secretion protein
VNHPPILALSAACLLVLPASARAFGLDAGASTFESGERRYAKPEVKLEDIRVPRVEVKAGAPTTPPPSGPSFAIDRFEVAGNTLLTPSQVDGVLAPFRGPGRSLGDVEKARDALQKRYEADGFLTVAVAIPQQTVESGTVRLEVLEARVGNVEVRNAGVHWVSDARVRSEVPHITPGAILRQEDLAEDMESANRSADARVRPQLEAGKRPGEVDVGLIVDDRIPLHGSLDFNNQYTPGSPNTRMDASASYSNLWGLGHEIGAHYQFVPRTGEFDQVQIWAGTYRMPMPWSDRQQLFGYYAKSDTTNASAAGGGIGILGKGENYGLRYTVDLPRVAGWREFSHALTFGVDHKNVENTVSESNANIVTPIKYLPFLVAWSGTLAREQTISTAHLGLAFNFAGLIGGGTKTDFQINRGGIDPTSPVNGDYHIVTLALQHTVRMPAVLQTLAAGHFVDLPKPEGSFFDDWTLDLSARGQVADQPLIATEQFAAGGVDSVRGYLQSEKFGDDAYDLQFTLASPFYRNFLGGRFGERVQLLAFWDNANLWLLNDPSQPHTIRSRLEGAGFGIRAGLFEHVNAEFLLGWPLIETENSDALRYHFRVAVGF